MLTCSSRKVGFKHWNWRVCKVRGHFSTSIYSATDLYAKWPTQL